VSGKSWTFKVMHTDARFDFFTDGRLRATYLPSPPHSTSTTVN